MAEFLVSGILEHLASILLRQMDADIRPVVHVDEEVQRLTSNLQAIRAVLDDAENRQVKESAVRDWLEKLKDASYEIDDVLDEWSTEIQKLQMKEVESASIMSKKKVCSLIPSYCFSPGQVILRRDIAIKIKDLNKTLGNIVREKDIFSFSLMKGTGEVVRPMTTSFSDEPEVYGREHDKNTIVNLLLNEKSEKTRLSIISVVGMGGIGKTTLARLIFNDDQVNAHFDIKIWVCVSDPFDELRIAKAILESLNGDGSNLVELQNVLERIHQSIEGKKFLLILDDVWTEDSRNWDQLKGSLKYGCCGSKILVTTRKENVAKIMGTTNIIPLGLLSMEECWSLFSRVAVIGKTNEEFEKLENIGRKIVQKCNGLPLAIKILGSLLRLKTKVEQWQSVLDSEIWKIEEIEKGLFPPLLLSYYDLPSRLRKCFLYCAIFPKDYELKKDVLVKLWMAQGYLKIEGREDMETVGEEYFEDLVMYSFFQDFKKNEYGGSIISCKMHDIVHDFAHFLSKNECFTIEVDDDTKSQLEFSYKKTRHLMIVGDSIPVSIYDENKLRSLVIVAVKNIYYDFLIEIDLSKLFDQLICLRTLNLSFCSIEELPKGVRKLIHLRYLNLSQNKRLEELPDTLCDLYNLEILDLSYCEYLQRLPRGIGKLINLRHLMNIGTNLSYMPKGVERLTCLRTLNKLIIGDGGQHKEEACTLECLKKLDHLQGSLNLRKLGCVREVDEANKAELKSKKNLTDLSLWFDEDEEGRMGYDEVVLEALEPPPSLEILEINCYTGKNMSPHWILSLTKLKMLTLSDCNSEELPPLGKLLSLEALYVHTMKSIKGLGNEFLGIECEATSSSSSIVAFPKLKTLKFLSMNAWEEWKYEINQSRDENVPLIMPFLQFLSIENCDKLKALSDYLLQSTTLDEMEIKNCSILNSDKLGIFSCMDKNMFPNMRKLTLHGSINCDCLPPLGKLPSLESLTIEVMSSVKKVGNEFLGIESGDTDTVFPKLKVLVFQYMAKWEEWEITWRNEKITIMPCLHFLKLYSCPKLKVLPNHILQLPILEKLEFNYCSTLTKRYNKETGVDWSKISHIPNIEIGFKYVQKDGC